jgi:hypothetical protein
MEFEDSLPRSQHSTTCRCAEPDKSSPRPSNRIPFNIRVLVILSRTLNVFQVVSFPQVSPPKPYIHLLLIRATCPA